MSSFSPSSGASTSLLSSEMIEDHNVLNMTPRLPLRLKHPSLKLMEEITTLEEEIMHMERHLLTLYRTVFQHYIPSAAADSTKHLLHVNGVAPRSSTDLPFVQRKSEISERQDGLQVNGSLTPRKDVSREVASELTREKDSLQDKKSAYGRHASLADHLEYPTARISPNRLSEDIIRCIAFIYCKLSNPKKPRNGHSVSSNSSYCSSGTFSPRNSWSPQLTDEGDELSNSECVLREKGSYSSMLEISRLALDKESYTYAAKMLQHFRSLVKSLEAVNPTKMSREEKLAFWINIHNALVMHGYLAYGTHSYIRNNSVMKASYIIGGKCLNACDIQTCILRIKAHSSSQWLQALLSPGRKIKMDHPYAIEYPEPLVHFALCTGMTTDPAVRVYSSKTIFDDLKVAKEEFLQSAVYLQNQTKLYLPKKLRNYAKDMSLTTAELVETINSSISEDQQKAIRRLMKLGRLEKNVCWIEATNSFRYVIHRKLAH